MTTHPRFGLILRLRPFRTRCNARKKGAHFADDALQCENRKICLVSQTLPGDSAAATYRAAAVCAIRHKQCCDLFLLAHKKNWFCTGLRIACTGLHLLIMWLVQWNYPQTQTPAMLSCKRLCGTHLLRVLSACARWKWTNWFSGCTAAPL